MDATGRPTVSDLTEADTRTGRLLDLSVAYSVPAAIGALAAAIAPAIMATRDTRQIDANGAAGDIHLRGSISSYWNIDPRYAFWLPFTVAAGLLLLDAFLSTVSANKSIFGRRYQNFFLGGSLLLLTWFNKDDAPAIHYPATYLFFLLFAAVMVYGGLLGWTGRHVDGLGDVGNRQAEKANGIVSLVFVGLLFLALIFRYPAHWIGHYFFEAYALIAFAFHYVMSAVNPFPYNYYEFKVDWVNRLFRTLRIMKSRPRLEQSATVRG